VTCKTAMFW